MGDDVRERLKAAYDVATDAYASMADHADADQAIWHDIEALLADRAELAAVKAERDAARAEAARLRATMHETADYCDSAKLTAAANTLRRAARAPTDAPAPGTTDSRSSP